MPQQFARLTANLVAKPRFAVMEGRDYIVLPTVIFVEGVHAGSGGPILYLLEDMERFAPAWNHKPIVVYHPKINGEFVSADNPTILSTSKVGLLMNNHIDGAKQAAESWLEKSRLQQIDNRILEALESGKSIEVSTGLFTDTEEAQGTWNGEEYFGIARNYRPDHLALLPDIRGACSLKDGCGLFANEESHDDVLKVLGFTVNPVHTCTSNGKPGYQWGSQTCYTYSSGDDAGRKAAKRKAHLQGAAIEANAQLQILEEQDTSGQEVEDDTATLPTGNENGDIDMSKENCECPKKKALVDNLIAANGDWKEDDRKWLSEQEEDILKKFTTMQEAASKKAEATKSESEEKEEKEDEFIPPTANTPKPAKRAKVTVEEYIKQAPQPIREVLARGLQAHQAERKRLTDVILSNGMNEFTEDELKGFEIPMLQKLSALAVEREEEKHEPVDLFSFVGSVGSPPPTANTQEEHLPLPAMNFKKDQK